MCQGLGLSMHPAVAQWLQSSKLQSQTPHTVVASLVYRCDLQTQFMAGLYVHLPAAPKPNPNPLACKCCRRILKASWTHWRIPLQAVMMMMMMPVPVLIRMLSQGLVLLGLGLGMMPMLRFLQ